VGDEAGADADAGAEVELLAVSPLSDAAGVSLAGS
jgi:hypothetical protein